MAIKIYTPDPLGLLGKIKKAIADKSVQTWELLVFEKKDYFTHTTNDGQWYKKAYLSPTAGVGMLLLDLHWPDKATDAQKSDPIYGVYHGRFAEMVLSHFKQSISSIDLT